MKKLYFIVNQGCDASTRGIVELSEQEFELMMQTVRNLNQNSYYGCMPTIYVREISWDDLQEVSVNEDTNWYDEGYVDQDYRFFYNGKLYTWKDQHDGWRIELLPELK